MNRNQLWNSILQQAISGRLVPQLDSEPAVEQVGPAPKPDEVPFELPAKWKWVQLHSMGRLLTGKTPKTSHPEYFGNEIPFITPGDIDSRCKVNYSNRGLTLTAKQVIKTVPAKTAFMVCIGASFGKCGVAASEIAFNQQINAIVHDERLLESSFLLSVFASPYFQRQMKLKAKATTIPIINKTEWGSLWLPLPPLEEQSRIVAKLDEIRHLVDKFGEAQEQLVKLEAEFPSKLKASVLQQAIKGLLVPQLDSEPEVEQVGPAPKPDKVPFELPSKWKWVQLYAVAEYNPEVDANDDLEVSFVPLEKLSWAYDWEPTFDQTKPWGTVKKGYKRFKDGDVIFAKITPSFHNRKSGLVTKACNGIGCGSTEFCVYRCQEQLLNKFLLWFFKSSYFINFGKRTYKGTAGQLRVNLDVINSMYLPLPPIEEQRRIVAKLEEVFAGVEKLGSLMEYA